jgi:hypothetical protein
MGGEAVSGLILDDVRRMGDHKATGPGMDNQASLARPKKFIDGRRAKLRVVRVRHFSG